MRFSAGCFRAGWIAAGTVPVNNCLGTRQAVVVGRPERFWNRPLEGGNLIPLPDFAAIHSEVASFTPRTTREVLEKMVNYLHAWGNKPVAEYYFGIKNGKYRNVVNTSRARSIILSVAFDGEKIAKVDRKIVDGQITEPINDIIHPFGILKYGINLLLIKLSAYLGYPKAFIILPVFDEQGEVIGKVNMGLRDTVPLSREKMEVLRLLAEKIKGTSRDNEVEQAAIDMDQVRSFITFVDSIPIYAFIGSPKVAEGARRLVSLLSSSIEKTLAERDKRDLEREQHFLTMQKERDRYHQEVMNTLVNAIEALEKSTGGHSIRVAQGASAVGQLLPYEVWATEMKRQGIAEVDWAKTIQQAKETMYANILPHDIGKIGVDTRILNLPRKLKPREYRIMQTHAKIGRERILRNRQRYADNPLLNQTVLDVAGLHHVDYDGLGYPLEGLKGTQIPLAARIARVVDSYDAMISTRPYQAALDPEEVINELVSGVGSHFDPVVVRTLLQLFSQTTCQNETDTAFMIDEIVQTLMTQKDPALRYLPEMLMEKLRGGSKVADLMPHLEKMRGQEGILPESEQWFTAMNLRVQDRKQRLIINSTLGLRFYDEVLSKITHQISDYTNSGHYSPEAVRTFITELFKAWQQGTDRHLIDLARAAFNSAGAKSVDFKGFFFEQHLNGVV